MSTSTQNPNFVEALKNINDFYIENALPVWCPVVDTSLKFKPLSIQQIKQFIELQVSVEKDEFGVIPGLNLLHKLNCLIQENCVEASTGLLKTLTIIDRDAVLLQLRANTKKTLELQDRDTPVEVDLSEIVSKLDTVKFTKKLKSRNVSVDTGSVKIELKLEIPSIQHDSDVNSFFVNTIAKPQLQKGRKQVENNVETLLSSIYIVEMSKYISEITIKKDDSKSVINFKDIETIANNIQILEKLPTSILSEISSYIKDIKKYRDSIISYSSVNGNQVPVDIDITFFTSI